MTSPGVKCDGCSARRRWSSSAVLNSTNKGTFLRKSSSGTRAPLFALSLSPSKKAGCKTLPALRRKSSPGGRVHSTWGPTRRSYGRPAASAHQNCETSPPRGRRSHGRSRDERARLYAPVHLRPVSPDHRPPAQPLPQGKAARESSPPAEGRQRSRFARCTPLRFRFRELLPPAVPPSLRHVAAADPRARHTPPAAGPATGTDGGRSAAHATPAPRPRARTCQGRRRRPNAGARLALLLCFRGIEQFLESGRDVA